MNDQEKIARCLCTLAGDDWDKLGPGPRAYWYGQAMKFIQQMNSLNDH